ncbi:MAG: amidohydrolase family protein [Aureliella sp.]
MNRSDHRRIGKGSVVSWLAICLGMCLSSQLPAQTSTAPEEGIQSRPPRTTLLRGGHIVASSAREIEQADLLIRDGKIAQVAPHIDAPADAEVIDCEGKYLYPAFIDPLVEQNVPTDHQPDSHWNGRIQSHRRVYEAIAGDDKVTDQYRRAGFGAILLAPNSGIFKGTSAVITTAKLPVAQTALRPNAFQHLALVLPRSERSGYPNSPMGVVALARQTLSDARWYQQAQQAFRADPTLPAPEANAALEALAPLVRGEQTAIIDSGNELYALRADRLAREFSLRAIIRGSGREYRRVDAIAGTERTYIVPVNFPKPPEVGSIEAAADVTLQSLMHWHLAPENPARLESAGVDFVLTASGLSSPGEMWKQVRTAIKRGLDEDAALDALTLRTAKLLEIDHLVGSLERGKLANVLVTTGPLWHEKTKIDETWVQGERYCWHQRASFDPSGRWQVKLTGGDQMPAELELQLDAMTDKPKGRLALPGELDKAKTEPASDKSNAAKPAAESEKKPPSAEPKKPLELKEPESDNPPKDDSQQPKAQPTQDQPTDKVDNQEPASEQAKKAETEPAKENPSQEDEDSKSHDKGPRVAELKRLGMSDFRIEALFNAEKLNVAGGGTARLSLTILSEGEAVSELVGRIEWPSGEISLLKAARVEDTDAKDAEAEDDAEDADDEQLEQKPEQASTEKSKQSQEKTLCEVNYPLGAFGVAEPPEQSEWVLVRGATLWTCDEAGILSSGDLLIHRGIIDKVGQALAAPAGATIIDARGKHVSPGIIDCHSHMATDGGVNESGQAVTAEVRIGDFIDPNDMTIYQQLAGGVTTANILHGSANPIGGQNQVIKLRWGASDDELKMREAPPGIKFALGENVKQSNWGDRATGRYPQTRMGVEQIIRDRFEAAKLYRQAHSAAAAQGKRLPPRRDYELEALVEVLEKQRWIHCHSYRQDEILAFLRTLEDYGVQVGSLQHVLEGYKIADAMAKHGATGSTFSDWWTYKFEVRDAIPFNGALMHRAGVIVSFNSDDNELGRHLNHEAAKAIKYGGVSPEEALKFVTLNPAKQLRIDQHVGSLAPGKHADFVIWSGSPLSTLSRCEQTWIDGRKYFDRDEDAEARVKAAKLHRALVERVLASGEKMSGNGHDEHDPSLWFVRYDEFCNHSGHDHDHENHR